MKKFKIYGKQLKFLLILIYPNINYIFKMIFQFGKILMELKINFYYLFS